METQQELIKATIQELLGQLGIGFTDISVDVDERTKSVRFLVSTPESALLIGEHGMRLLALNHVVKKIIEKKSGSEDATSFMVDVNDYQKKRIDDIRGKAHMLAERARYFKSTVEMEPMSSYERMIVHAEFGATVDIETESFGHGRDRHVVIKYSETKTLS